VHKIRVATELAAVIALQVGLSRLLSFATSDATDREDHQYCEDPAPTTATLTPSAVAPDRPAV